MPGDPARLARGARGAPRDLRGTGPRKGLRAADHAIAILITSLACAGIGTAALVACRGRLPHSYTAWSAVLLVLAVTSPFFTSEPRYLAAILPLLITVPAVLRSRRAWYLFAAVDIGLFCCASELALGLHQVA